MSTLQIGLAIIGGLVLAGVVAYNAWITRHSAPRLARERSTHPPGDPSGDETVPYSPEDLEGTEIQRIDPVLGDMPGVMRPDPAAIAVAAAAVSVNPLLNQPEKRPGLDALIDVITPLVLDHEVSGDALLAALPGTRRVGSKPFAVEGLCDASGEWETPRLGQRYRALQAGVQLANRAGALNDIEFSEFVVKAQAFADAVGAAPEFPDMRAEVARGRELDAFASGHDAQLGFTLRARRAAWSPGYVAQHAAKLGFVAGALPGRMVLSGSQMGQAPVLSLVFDPQAAMAEDPEQSALREVALSLEVTHVPRSEQPFVRMRQTAMALAEAMDGIVTDDAGQPLSTDTMDGIGADLESLYDALDSRDLSAGSAQARRLFS
ncbi:cell division protein ZipA C-terminal FtsZ-binding domain-containing protein [Hydrogenophaga sp. PBL-H3]|uniref:cell division protein ZipA C-terminal FtsZ-binding domain-containing protein n=1 Tax=Hydrogenophaga sp. PBL-H3 TaxID=434010 RepID=UPI00132048F1|nr:cell division protein ZipA C-terminal FtsZ-binding domain-containing protein [Hydrogenophaga sp. PBL-H3]QHE76461.1 cell division protein FtsZ [Hydrogenophaga sp. PBL-H3]QHE80885.1 cell division protein FtsZ [Hydrogenophaga sp. PBL-H3]